MVVGDLHLVGVAISPDKTNAVLVVDSDTVLTFSGASQDLQTIARNRRQVAERSCLVQMEKPTERGPFYEPELFRGLLPKDPFGLSISKRLDHTSIVYRYTI